MELGADGIPAVVLKKCDPELSYIPAEPFNMCLKESILPDNSSDYSSLICGPSH